ncbi:Phosphoribosylformylglycinamidine synthase subunit PurQ [Geodia barretti]|uniref:Phosphoribosylformylglycinamidine synthase subunit PurQ n=1 Tax=Geodia barretti TaxID=519541 RepID=A0AA35W1C9_GEOBA|nr:Phosphoribosylformylglycinamidine synthase subunit PurQ [Geodia barretti]
MKFGVLIFPGSNCEHDAYHAVRKVLQQPAEFIWHQSTDLKDCQAIIVPGGFSYGDYLRTGAIARFSPVMGAVRRFADRGGLVLGICNGFQILLESGLLPGAMLRNRGLKYVCQQVSIRVENARTPFTGLAREGDVWTIPIGHMEGNYTLDSESLHTLETNRQPNGSVANVAGICNPRGNVLGMMPHPERASEPLLGSEDGMLLFQSMIHASQSADDT